MIPDRRSSRTYCIFVVTLMLVLKTWPATNSEVKSSVPASPTYEDCRLIDRRHWQYLNAVSKEIHECMLQAPQFGSGYDWNCKLARTVAWSQCAPFDHKRCEASRRRKEDQDICLARARRSAQEYEQEQKVREVALGIRAYKRFGDAYDLIRNPAAFFARALGPRSPILRRLLEGKHGEDGIPSLGSEIYGLMYRQARDGLRAENRLRIIRAVQEAALAEIDRYYKQTFAELDQAAHDIRAFDATLRTWQQRPAQGSTTILEMDADCAVLDDAVASRSANAASPADWLKLLARCSSKER